MKAPSSSISTLLALCVSSAGCGDEEAKTGPGPTLRSDVRVVTTVEEALEGVFIPPYPSCTGPAGSEVCTNVSIAGATRPGQSFSESASCDVVRTQRPYWPAAPARRPDPEDARLADADFMREVRWARDEVRATGCACCHQASVTPTGASQWDLEAEPIWLDTVSDTGLALFAGLADSSVLGAYPASDNHGFDRSQTGLPTTDVPRLKALLGAELARRGLSEEWAGSVPPFGGPIYQNSVRAPVPCGEDEGIDAQGRVRFRGETVRYVYVLEAGSANPGVPPNLDRPAGLLWRLDVLPSQPAVNSGVLYGTTPRGSYQDTPELGPAPALVAGRRYQLYALVDVGLPILNCTFELGREAAAVISGIVAVD